MGAASKRAKKTRSAAEFDIARLSSQLATPVGSGVPLTSWTLPDTFAARDDQTRGHFYRPANLAKAMRTCGPLAVALESRLAPQRCTRVEMVAAKGARGASISAEAEALFGQNGVGISPDTMGSIHETLVNHDIAIGLNVATPREDGSRIDFALQSWPIEHVRWDPYKRCLLTRVDMQTLPTGEVLEGGEVPIVHGDGRWVVFQRFELDPWTHGALLPASLTWVRLAMALRDWAKGSLAQGTAKVIGTMPEGVALKNESGNTPEAQAFLDLLRAIASDDSPVGIQPFGAAVDFLASGATNWQIFKELVDYATSDAARIYLGTDGTLGSKGGAPGVDVQSLFGVAATRVEGDLKCLERGLRTGVIEPWCAVNFGDSTLAPTRKYMLPDADADAARASLATRKAAFYAEIEQARANGFEINQEIVNRIAAEHGVPPPSLPLEAKRAPSIALAPTDIARVVTVNEARASAGVGPLVLPTGAPDPDGALTVEQFAAKKAAQVAPAAAPALRAVT